MFAIFKKDKTHRWSLRSRLTLMLILALLLFQIVMMIITMSMGLLPVMRQSVEDLSERLIKSAQHWSSLPENKKRQYEVYSRKNAGFYFFNDKKMDLFLTHPEASGLVFNKLLSTALTTKLNHESTVNTVNYNNKNFYWINLKVHNKFINIGFEHSRIGTNPTAIFIALVILNIVFSLLTAFVFVRYITQPLMNLLNAAKSLGRGIKPELEHKNNSREIQDLYDQFEKMSTEVQSLLENRNTLLIGISHELRTPITRLTLLLEMARDRLGDSSLNDCNQVLQEMNVIIEQFLSLGRGITVQESTRIDFNDEIQKIIDSFDTNRINYTKISPYRIDIPIDALRRVVLNIIDNALKYSGDKSIDITVETDKSDLIIYVLDRGIGIPEGKTTEILQAFVRVNKDKHLNVKGVGLGLAISHLIAQTNGWTLTFLSRQGGGSIVKLDIPH